MRINTGNLIADNCHFYVQGKVETRSCHSKGKDKEDIIAAPLKGNEMQTRLSRLKQISSEKEEEIPTRQKRKEK